MSELKKNAIMLVVLVTLIILNYVFAENGMQNAVYFIVVVSAIKFIGVVFQFIEAKHAHSAWKGLSFVFVAIYLIGVLVMY